jgi:hypothetical protein
MCAPPAGALYDLHGSYMNALSYGERVYAHV